MKIKLLIIGKNSFIGDNLYKFSNKKKNIKKISYSNFFKINKKKLSSFDIILNCSSNIKYVNNNYSEYNDFDLQIAKKIRNFNCKYIFISTRKVYKHKFNLKENDIIQPCDNYSKNKFITEEKLKKVLKNKLLILRLSNIIGFRRVSQRTLHTTFIDIFFKNIRKGLVLKVDNEFKDFLGIKQLVIILDKIIEKKLSGTYNVSLGKKVYLYEILNWLNYYNSSSLKHIKLKNKLNIESFTLNNNKLLKKIKYKIKKKNLENECKLISKLYFKKK